MGSQVSTHGWGRPQSRRVGCWEGGKGCCFRLLLLIFQVSALEVVREERRVVTFSAAEGLSGYEPRLESGAVVGCLYVGYVISLSCVSCQVGSVAVVELAGCCLHDARVRRTGRTAVTDNRLIPLERFQVRQHHADVSSDIGCRHDGERES